MDGSVCRAAAAPAIRLCHRRCADVCGYFAGRTQRRTNRAARGRGALCRIGRARLAALNMNRSLVILLGALALGAVIFAGSILFQPARLREHDARPADDLSWLQSEFHLSDAEMARIRQLHEGYLPQCIENVREDRRQKGRGCRCPWQRNQRHRRGCKKN